MNTTNTFDENHKAIPNTTTDTTRQILHKEVSKKASDVLDYDWIDS